jgi:predicted GNAT family acetyltransferase
VALIQGVWVDPSSRGQGLAAPGTAAVVDRVHRLYQRLPSLYVNHDNLPARACYSRVGFRQVGTFASVQF